MKCSIEFRDLFMTMPLVIRCNQNAFYAHLLCIQCFHRKSAATTLLMEVYINLHWLPGTGSQSAKIIWDWCWMCVQKKKPNIHIYRWCSIQIYDAQENVSGIERRKLFCDLWYTFLGYIAVISIPYLNVFNSSRL